MDVVVVRHVLWAFEKPSDVLASWISLLAPGGRLLLVEGRWSTGAGLAAADCEALVRQHRQEAQVRMLREPSYRGKDITDERYLLVSSC